MTASESQIDDRIMAGHSTPQFAMIEQIDCDVIEVLPRNSYSTSSLPHAGCYGIALGTG